LQRHPGVRHGGPEAEIRDARRFRRGDRRIRPHGAPVGVGRRQHEDPGGPVRRRQPLPHHRQEVLDHLGSGGQVHRRLRDHGSRSRGKGYRRLPGRHGEGRVPHGQERAEAGKIEMNFLPDVYIECDVCHGKRYNMETLEVLYKTKSISDVLDMRIDDALEFFGDLPRIKRKVKAIHDVGLGYIRLGQQATTLSGGEAQRVKLATELSKVSTGKTLYILDEPTTGLHFEDVRILLGVLNKLVEKGNTVIVVEHNLDVIKTADWIIDLGPGGGEHGGEIIAEGTPEQIADNPKSVTGKFLRSELK